MDKFATQQAYRYLEHLEAIMRRGNKLAPRGFEILEIEDQQLELGLEYPFMTFGARKYSVNYFKQEMLWKLGANPYDESIKSAAKMWESVQNPDKTFNSNYGVYWFGPQGGIWSVVTELIRDPDSRRAIIPMLSKDHMSPQTVDTVCTEAVGFRIRYIDGQYRLNMSVHMRSSDAVFGLGTDIATFAFLYRLVYALIQPSIPIIVLPGTMTITMMSSHIYARHYDIVNQILLDGVNSYEPVTMPWCDFGEAMYLIAKRGKIPAATRGLSGMSYDLIDWIRV